MCIFAYGQTGSGKTYSMVWWLIILPTHLYFGVLVIKRLSIFFLCQFGPEIGSVKDSGINSKALNDLFQISCIREDIKYELHVQMVEIYNEQVRDLLSEEASTTKYPLMHIVLLLSED